MSDFIAPLEHMTWEFLDVPLEPGGNIMTNIMTLTSDNSLGN